MAPGVVKVTKPVIKRVSPLRNRSASFTIINFQSTRFGMVLKKGQKQGRDENTKKTILLQKSRGKERLEDYSTSVA